MAIFKRVKTWTTNMTASAVDYEFNNMTTTLNNRFIGLPATQNFASAAPTASTWSLGDIVWNNNPSSGGFVGFVCVVAGTPGTWKTFGLIS